MKWNVTLDFSAYYAENIEANTKTEAVEIAIKKYNNDKDYDLEVVNTEVDPCEE